MQHVITDDLAVLLAVLPPRVQEAIAALPDRGDLLEIVLDLGRPAEGRFPDREVILSNTPITEEDIAFTVGHIGEFGEDNRAGIGGTLHRISALRNRRGTVIGLTCRVGRAIRGTVALIRDVVEEGKSILILGRPGVGKTTLLREAARVLADELGKRVVVVDTSNEIAGDGDIPHPGIGRARRMQVARPAEQHAVMIEAVENHMPEVVVIDEIGTELEAQAARTIAERGVQLVGTAHGRTLDNLLANPTLSDLVGGIQAVTLGDEEARRRGTQKTVLERKQPPTFDVLIEQQSWRQVIVHKDIAEAVDELLRGHSPTAELRERDDQDRVTVRRIVIQPENTVSAQASDVMGRGMDDFDHPDRGDRHSGRGDVRQIRALRDPRRASEPEPFFAEEDEDDLDVEAVEPTGTTGAPARTGLGTSTVRRRKMRIYPFGVSRERLEQSAKHLHVPVEISRDQNDADAVIALKTLYRRQPEQLRAAESVRKPIYVLRTNTVAQMSECLARIFELRDTEAAIASGEPSSPATQVRQQTEDAIHSMLNSNRREVELPPQNAYLRRMQHEIAGRYNLESRSRGREPNRRVQIFGR